MKTLMLTSLISFLLPSADPGNKHLKVGDQMPSFSLRDQNGEVFDVDDFVGKNILVVYFYPKDESSGCTKEACAFRDHYEDFKKAGALVIGINSGSVKSHLSFIKNHQLPFTLLSDPGNKVLKMFGVKNKVIITGRETFIIDKTGKIVFTYDSFTNGAAHQREAIDYIKSNLSS